MLLKIKRLLVDVPSAILMIVCFTLVIFIILNIADLIGKIQREREGINKFTYSVDALLDLNIDKESTSEFLNYVYLNTNTNVFLTDIKIYINNEPTNYVCNIILKYDEQFNFKSAFGHEIITSEIESGCILLGQTMAYYLVNTYGDRSKITISGNTLSVIDILENNMSGGIDNAIWIIWDKVPPDAKEILTQLIAEQPIIRISFRSNISLTEIYSNFSNQLLHEWNCQPQIFEASYSGAYQNLWHQSYGVLYNGLSFLFAMSTIFIAINLWLLRRKKEIVIRKTYGFSTAKIIGILIIDILLIIAFAIILALFLQLFYHLIFGSNINILGQLPTKLGVVLLGIIGLMSLILNHLLREISKISIVEGLTRG